MKADHIYGDSSRLFLNIELGCRSACSYCYLPQLNYKIETDASGIERVNARQLIEALKQDARLIPGRTILSIGCFSECWDPKSRSETVELVEGLLEMGYQVQIATKRQVSQNQLAFIGSAESLAFFISSATISHWNLYERRTAPPKLRFKSFAAISNAGLKSFLYIKPVIPGVTIRDVEAYGAVMKDYGVGAVVGGLFEPCREDGNSPISKRLKLMPHPEVAEIQKRLREYGPIFSTSVEAMSSLR